MFVLRLAAVLCLGAALSYAQNVGEIRLAVKDATGASVQAGGTIEGLATGVHRDFQTDDKGLHTFTGPSVWHLCDRCEAGRVCAEEPACRSADGSAGHGGRYAGCRGG